MMACSCTDKLVEIDWMILERNQIVEDRRVGRAQETAHLVLGESSLNARIGTCVDDQLHQRTGLVDALLRIFETPDMKQNGLAEGQTDLAAGLCVIIDVGHAVRREMILNQREEPLLQRGCHPGVDTMCDNVIERPSFGWKLNDIIHAQFDVVDL